MRGRPPLVQPTFTCSLGCSHPHSLLNAAAGLSAERSPFVCALLQRHSPLTPSYRAPTCVHPLRRRLEQA